MSLASGAGRGAPASARLRAAGASARSRRSFSGAEASRGAPGGEAPRMRLGGEAAAIGKKAVSQCPWCRAREFVYVPSKVGLIVVTDHHRQISEIRRLTGAERPHDVSKSQDAGKGLRRDAEFVSELGDEVPLAPANLLHVWTRCARGRATPPSGPRHTAHQRARPADCLSGLRGPGRDTWSGHPTTARHIDDG